MRWLAICLLLAPAAGLSEPAADRGLLVVHVRGVRSAEGTVRVKILDHGRDFPQSDDAVARQKQPASAEPARFEFADLPHGTYAVIVLHDEDDDAMLGRSLLGLPREGLGFSNEARIRFGPPKFAEAAIELRAKRLELAIEVVY